MLIGILTVVEVIVCLRLILIVLMQRPRQEGLGASFGDSMTSQVWGAQTTNVLQKFTVRRAVVRFVLTLALAILTAREQGGSSKKIFGDAPAETAPVPAAPAAAPAPANTSAPAAPAVTVTPTPAPAAAAPAKADAPKADAPKAEAPKAPAPAAAPATPAPAPAAPAPAPAPTTPATPK